MEASEAERMEASEAERIEAERIEASEAERIEVDGIESNGWKCAKRKRAERTRAMKRNGSKRAEWLGSKAETKLIGAFGKETPATGPTPTARKMHATAATLERAQRLPTPAKRQHMEPGLVPPLVDLEKIAEYGRLHLTLEQMAPLLDMAVISVKDMLQKFPTVLRAYEWGLSHAVYRASKCLADAIDDGDTATARYFLERKGGWTAPETAPAVHVHANVQTITVDSSHVTELGRRQAEILGVGEPIDADSPSGVVRSLRRTAA